MYIIFIHMNDIRHLIVLNKIFQYVCMLSITNYNHMVYYQQSYIHITLNSLILNETNQCGFDLQALEIHLSD